MKQREYTVPKNLKYDGKLYYNNFIGTQDLMIFANYWSTDNQKKLVMKYDTYKNDIRIFDDNADVTSSVDILNREEYIKERLLEIESEKSDLEKELKELELPKVGKIYDIVVDGNMNKNVYVDEIENDYIRFKYISNRSIGNESVNINRIKQFIHKPEYDQMAKQIRAFIELGKVT